MTNETATRIIIHMIRDNRDTWSTFAGTLNLARIEALKTAVRALEESEGESRGKSLPPSEEEKAE
ncbi:MAG: hypothetical protein ACREBI_12125 [Nitrosotalea sp.]